MLLFPFLFCYDILCISYIFLTIFHLLKSSPPSRMAKENKQTRTTTKTLIMPSVGRDVEELECIYISSMSVSWCTHFGNLLAVTINLNICYPMTQQFYCKVYTQEKSEHVYQNVYARLFIIALYIIIKTQKFFKYPLIVECINKFSYIHKIKYYCN